MESSSRQAGSWALASERRNGAVVKEKCLRISSPERTACWTWLSLGLAIHPDKPKSLQRHPSPYEDAWLGADNDPRPADGVVFSGAGAISTAFTGSRIPLDGMDIPLWRRCVSNGRDPTSLRRRKPRKQRAQAAGQPATPERTHTPGIPRPLVMAPPQPLPHAQKENTPEGGSGNSPSSNDQQADKAGFGTDTVMKYLTLGYGSAWSFPNRSAPASSPSSPPLEDSPAQPGQSITGKAQQNEHSSNNIQSPSAQSSQGDRPRNETKNNVPGRFVLGARDDLDTLDDLEEGSPEPARCRTTPESARPSNHSCSNGGQREFEEASGSDIRE